MTRLNLSTIQSPSLWKNQDRDGFGEHGNCRVCGKAIRNPDKAKMVHEVDGGGWIATPDEPYTDDGSDLGGQYIGSDCYRKHKTVLSPYILRADDIT